MNLKGRNAAEEAACYVSGVEAREKGKSRAHCQHSALSWRGAFWLAGWHDKDIELKSNNEKQS